MKLYVWTGYCPDFTNGLAVAIAESLEQAQQLVLERIHAAGVDEPWNWGQLQVYPLDAPIAFQVWGGS